MYRATRRHLNIRLIKETIGSAEARGRSLEYSLFFTLKRRGFEALTAAALRGCNYQAIMILLDGETSADFS
jgi:hypothetical protein